MGLNYGIYESWLVISIYWMYWIYVYTNRCVEVVRVSSVTIASLTSRPRIRHDNGARGALHMYAYIWHTYGTRKSDPSGPDYISINNYASTTGISSTFSTAEAAAAFILANLASKASIASGLGANTRSCLGTFNSTPAALAFNNVCTTYL